MWLAHPYRVFAASNAKRSQAQFETLCGLRLAKSMLVAWVDIQRTHTYAGCSKKADCGSSARATAERSHEITSGDDHGDGLHCGGGSVIKCGSHRLASGLDRPSGELVPGDAPRGERKPCSVSSASGL